MDDFVNSPLVAWVTGLSPAQGDDRMATLDLLIDGVFLGDLLQRIDPVAFAGLRIQKIVNGDFNIRTQNLGEILHGVRNFYQEKLQLLLVMKLPNVLMIAKEPENAQSLHELQKILLLILGCAVQCDGKEHFIEKIKELDVAIQEGLVMYIKEITENPDYVISGRINDVAEFSQEELFGLSESMFYQLQRLLQERDEYNEMLLDMSLEKQLFSVESNENSSNHLMSPPLSPGGSFKASVYQKNKTKLRDVQMELEEKNIFLLEAKEEISGLKTTVEALKQENKHLMTDARWANAYRDELDILKAQVERANKFEAENIKFKEKMRELDFYKKRFEELKEQHELLYETKLVLEEQVKSSTALTEKAGNLEQENIRLRKQIELYTEESESSQQQIHALMDDVHKLSNDKENSFCEVASLNAELDGLRTQNSNVPMVPLAMECNESSSTELLRFEKENRHLTRLVESLKQQAPKIRELEKENLTLESMLKDHKKTIMKMTEELALEKGRAKDLAEIVDGHAQNIDGLNSSLNLKSKHMQDIYKELDKKGIDLEALQSTFINSSSEDQLTHRDSMPTLKEIQTVKIELEEKAKELAVCETKLEEAESTGKELGNELGQRKEQVNRLENRVKEYETYGEKVENQLAQREKDIVELERRFEKTVIENKTLNQTIFLKEDKINALEERIAHFMDSASQDTKKVNETLEKKFKETQELELKVLKQQELVQDRNKIEVELSHKSEKLKNLITELSEKEKGRQLLEIELEKTSAACSQAEHSSKLKAERIKALEASLEEVKVESTVQLDTKVTSLTEALKNKSDSLTDVETRLDEVVSLNNKLKTTANLKNERIQTLEELITDLEGRSDHTRDEKVEKLGKKLQAKEEQIATLENRLEDSLGKLTKQGKTIELKDSKINELDIRIQELEEFQRQSSNISRQLQEKNAKVNNLESLNVELQSSCQKFESLLTQKEQKYNQAQTSLLELENALSDHGSLSKLVQLKEDKINLLQGSLMEKERQIVELEHKNDENSIKIEKLAYSIRMKDEKTDILQSRLDSHDELESQHGKMKNWLGQRDEKIKLLEDQIDESKEWQRLNKRLKESVSQKEEKIISLEGRLHDLDEAVNINTRLNNQVEIKDKALSSHQKRIHDLEDALKKVESTRDSIKHNSEEEILFLHRRIDELTDGKVKRQHSLRRREQHISTLETKLEEIETTTQRKEDKIQQLQSRLEGTTSKFETLGMSSEGKDERINELETRIKELSATYKDNRALTSKLESTAKDAEEMKTKAQQSESTCSRQQQSLSEMTKNISSLQGRLDEVLALNSRLDLTSKKQEEKVQQLEEKLKQQTDECDSLNSQKQDYEKTIQRQKKRIEDLEEALAMLEGEMESMSKKHFETEQARRAEVQRSHQKLNEKDNLIDDLERKVDSAPSVSRQEVVVIPISKDREEKHAKLQTKINSLTNENHQLKLEAQERQNNIAEFERKVEELHTASGTNSNRLNTLLKEKTTQIGLLRSELDSCKEDLAKMETKCLELSSGNSRTENAIKQKDARIQTIKEQLEERRNKSHELLNELDSSNEKIVSLEKSLEDATEKFKKLDEDYASLQLDYNALKNQSDGEKSSVENIVEKIQLTKRARTELHITRAAPRRQHIVHVSDLSEHNTAKDERISLLEEQSSLLEKEKSRLALQNRSLASENASIQTENESLRSELELLRADYYAIREDLSEAKEHYKELDFSATKIVHRCEVLVQLNGTLEEENSALMDQINKLLAQNQELLMKSLQTKDDYIEEERAFSDRLFALEQQKEQLLEQVTSASKSVADNRQKKSGFWRGATKVLKKAGLKKRKDDASPISLLRMQQTVDGESLSDCGSGSSFSPRYRSDESGAFSPVDHVQEPVVMRRQMERVERPVTYYGEPLTTNAASPADSPSNSSDRSSGSSRREPRIRPLSEYRTDHFYQSTSTPTKSVARPRKAEKIESFKADNTAFMSDIRARHSSSNSDDREEERAIDVPASYRNRVVSSASNHSSASETSTRSHISAASGSQHAPRPPLPPERKINSSLTRSSHGNASVQKVRVKEAVIPLSPQVHRVKDERKMIAEFMSDVPVEDYADLPDGRVTSSTNRDNYEEYDPVHVNIRDGQCSVLPKDDETAAPLPSYDLAVERNANNRSGMFYAPTTNDDFPPPVSDSNNADGQRYRPSDSYYDGNHNDASVSSTNTYNPSQSNTAQNETDQYGYHEISSTSDSVRTMTDSEDAAAYQRQRSETEPKKNPVWYEYGCV